MRRVWMEIGWKAVVRAIEPAERLVQETAVN